MKKKTRSTVARQLLKVETSHVSQKNSRTLYSALRTGIPNPISGLIPTNLMNAKQAQVFFHTLSVLTILASQQFTAPITF
jgi:hypothetical protein